MRTLLVSVATVLLAAALLLQEDAIGAEDGDDGLTVLQEYLDSVDTLSAGFEQSLVDANDMMIESSSGTVQIRRPGQFRWSYETPYAQELVADGLNVWSYDIDLEQVTVKPQAEMLANTPATLLGGSRAVLDEFTYVGETTDNRGTVWLTLEPRNADNGFNRVELGFDDGVLKRMIFADNLEQTTLVAFTDVSLNEPVADDVFRFKTPAGVDLVGEPLVADGGQ